MKVEQQVCTLQQAKRLKELGIEQFISLFRWCVFSPDLLGEQYYYEPVFKEGLDNAVPGEFIADAFTVFELSQMFKLIDLDGYTACEKTIAKWESPDFDPIAAVFNPQFLADNIIEALERKHITIEACNKAINA